MQLISVSADTFLVFLLCALPLAHYVLKRTQASSQSPYRGVLTILVLLHTVYIVYVLTMLYPPNIFARLRVPISTPADRIRSAILARAGLDGNTTLPKPLETLLTRLSSFDIRVIYIRFGQAVIQDCEYCRTLDQYALFALPGPLLQYIREAALVGLLTVPDSHRNQWRTHGIVAVVVALVAEAYTIATANIAIPMNGKDVFMYHDTLWLLRQLFFLVLPVVIHSLPPTAPINTRAAMQQLGTSMELIMGRAASARYLRGAIMREPSLRASAMQWWDKQKLEGQWMREDETVQKTAEKMNSGFVEGLGQAKLLPKVKAMTDALLGVAFAPPQLMPRPPQ